MSTWNVSPRHSPRRRGQHFLVDRVVLRRIADHAMLQRDETVLEVGAGTGNLTTVLQEHAGKIIAVEKDLRLVDLLRRRFHRQSHVEIVEGDVLKIPLPTFDKVVSSPPYYISSRLIFLLLGKKFDSMTMTFQKEFASRLIAEPGSADYGRLTVAVRHKADVKILDFIPRKAFRPIPRVDSYVVQIVPRINITPVNEDFLDRMIRYLFSQRRRMLRGVLKRAMNSTTNRSFEDLASPGYLLEKRIFQLTISELESLSNSLSSRGDLFKFWRNPNADQSRSSRARA